MVSTFVSRDGSTSGEKNTSKLVRGSAESVAVSGIPEDRAIYSET